MKTIILLCTLFAMSSGQSFTGIMGIGITFKRIGLEMSFSGFKPDGSLFQLSGGYAWAADDINNGNYESMTSVMGTVNVYDDREDGEFTNHSDIGFGLLFATPLEGDKLFLMHNMGYTSHEENHFNKFYDAYEILGDNGKYYLESPRASQKERGLEIGTTLFYNIYPGPASKIYLYGGGMISNLYGINGRLGMAIALGI